MKKNDKCRKKDEWVWRKEEQECRVLKARSVGRRTLECADVRRKMLSMGME